MDKKLQSGFHHSTLRLLQESGCGLAPYNLMYPVFLIADDDSVEPIDSMPEQSRYGVNRLRDHLSLLVEKGLKSILLFGVVDAELKDGRGTHADSAENPVLRALPKLREWFPNLLLACDVCLCPYTKDGHCGFINEHNHEIRNGDSIQRLGEIALAYAKAGAHIVAPSDMMDNRIQTIKRMLAEANCESCVSVLSYSAKFSSSFYGPFRDAAQSAPSFGDRRRYQLPTGSNGLALRAAQRDVEEGADLLMVKPGLAYLDVVRQTKDLFPHHPLYVYQVSGEYAMLYHAAKNGAFDLRAALMETMKSFRRAGADCIITYFTPLLLDMMADFQ